MIIRKNERLLRRTALFCENGVAKISTVDSGAIYFITRFTVVAD